MVTLRITLNDDQNARLEALLARRGFATPDEFFVDALDMRLPVSKTQQHIESTLLERLKTPDEEFTTFDPDEWKQMSADLKKEIQERFCLPQGS